MVTIEEKVELAKELGLDYWASTQQKEIDKKRTVNDLTAMKMPVVNETLVKALLGHGTVRLDLKKSFQAFLDALPESVGVAMAIMLFGALIGTLVALVGSARSMNIVWFYICLPLFAMLALAATFVLTGFEEIEVKSSPLKIWDKELPYGAMLAVKEAKKNGLKEFTIWYPTLMKPKSDPIITAEKNGVMVQVFAWNLGEIEE